MFSVFTIADFIASSLERPFWIALQYFLEKLLEILFCSKLTLGSDVSKSKPIAGFNWKIINKNQPKNSFNNRYYLTILNNILVFKIVFSNKSYN